MVSEGEGGRLHLMDSNSSPIVFPSLHTLYCIFLKDRVQFAFHTSAVHNSPTTQSKTHSFDTHTGALKGKVFLIIPFYMAWIKRTFGGRGVSYLSVCFISRTSRWSVLQSRILSEKDFRINFQPHLKHT